MLSEISSERKMPFFSSFPNFIISEHSSLITFIAIIMTKIKFFIIHPKKKLTCGSTKSVQFLYFFF